MQRNNANMFIFVSNNVMYEYIKSLTDGVNNLLDNTQVQIKIYRSKAKQTQPTMSKYYWNNKRNSKRLMLFLRPKSSTPSSWNK
jgi:hypothetical protein